MAISGDFSFYVAATEIKHTNATFSHMKKITNQVLGILTHGNGVFLLLVCYVLIVHECFPWLLWGVLDLINIHLSWENMVYLAKWVTF